MPNILAKDCVHTCEHILLGLLEHQLLMNHTNLPYFLKITFNVILPKRKQEQEHLNCEEAKRGFG